MRAKYTHRTNLAGSFSEYFALRGTYACTLMEGGNQCRESASYSKARSQTLMGG